MWYIYENNGKTIYSDIEPKNKEYFTIDKMPPIPNEEYMELKADFETKTVWFEKRELTEEEIKAERVEEIKAELNELDQTINRATEDLYVLTNSTPYQSVQEIINKKTELRVELKNINEGEDKNEESNL